ncbi:MAG: EamA family transporter [Chloroflexi bacterium]|nr:EamA family transporter [Chloroflexota bacterium]
MTQISAPRRQLLLGYGASLLAAVAYGSVAVVGRKIVIDFAPPLVATSFSMIFGTMILFALFHRQFAADIAAKTPGRAWLFVAIAGGSATWGVTFWFLALKEAPVVLVAPLAGTYPLMAAVLASIFLRRLERVTWQTFAGAALVVGGAILITFGVQ